MSLRIPGKRAHDQVKRDALLGDAYALTRDFESADERLNSALERASLLGDDDLVAHVGYHLVRRHLLEENAERARAALELARRGRSRESRIYALNSETMILLFEERLYDQAERLTERLRQLDPNELEFFRVRSSTTMRLAVLARELYLPDAVAEIERHLDGLAWPKDFATDQFITHQALAWAKAHQGDYFNAFRHLKRASELAHNTAWKVFAACDSAFLARHFGQRGWSRIELDEAEQLASEVDWYGTLGEERTGLLSLAELFSAVDTARASTYLAQYRSLGEIRSPAYYRHDVRREADEKYSTGVVELALGNRTRGLSDVREARALFERVGYDFRAAACLESEYRAT